MKNLIIAIILLITVPVYAQKKTVTPIPAPKAEVTKQDSVPPFNLIGSDTIRPVLIIYLDDQLQVVSEVGFVVAQQGNTVSNGKPTNVSFTIPIVVRPTTTTTKLPNGKDDTKTVNNAYEIQMNRILYFLDKELNVIYKK